MTTRTLVTDDMTGRNEGLPVPGAYACRTASEGGGTHHLARLEAHAHEAVDMRALDARRGRGVLLPAASRRVQLGPVARGVVEGLARGQVVLRDCGDQRMQKARARTDLQRLVGRSARASRAGFAAR